MGYLNFCPRCGRQDLDRDGHGSPGTALCRACGTLFSVLSVRFGEKMVVLSGDTAKVASGAGAVPEEPSTETTLPMIDEEDRPTERFTDREKTLRIVKKVGGDDGAPD